jgi:Fe-S oxidoreductase
MSEQAAVLGKFEEYIAHLGERAPAQQRSDDERLARAKQAFRAGLDGAMAIDLECCIHCGMCAEACHFYESTQQGKYAPIHKLAPLRRFYHRELGPLRWLFRLFTRDLSLKELGEWQEFVYDSCTMCARCDMICPMGIQISPMVGVMRSGLAAAELVPRALAAGTLEQKQQGTVFGTGAAELAKTVETLRQQGLVVNLDKETADIMLLSTAMDVNVYTRSLAGMVKIMNRLGVDWTLRSAAFEATNFGMLSGDREAEEAATRRIIDEALACGAKTIIIPECGHAYAELRWEAANIHGQPLPFEVVAISEFLGRELQAGRLKLKSSAIKQRVTYHDPCKMGRLGGVLDEPRALLDALGVELTEMESHGATNYCCGGGGGVMLIEGAAMLRQRAFEIKMRQVDDTGADAVVTTCDSCRTTFITGAQNANWQTSVESLVELVAENLED